MPDSDRIAVAKQGEFPGHKGSVFALALDSAETRLYSGGDDGVLVRWNPDAPDEPGLALLQTDTSVYSLAVDTVSAWLFAGFSDGTLRVFDTNNQQLIHTYRPGTQPVYGLFPDPETGLLWVLHGGGMMSVFRIAEWKLLEYARLSPENLRAIAPSRDGRLFIGSGDGQIYALDRQNGMRLDHWAAHELTVFSLLTDEEGMLYSGGRDARIRAWETRSQVKEVYNLPAHLYTVNDLALMPGTGWMVSASRDKTLKIWEPAAGKLLKVVDWERNMGHRHSVNRILWRNKDKCIFSCSDDRRIIRWEFKPES